MEYYDESALRHFANAEALANNNQYDGAGYLIGYAVECAIKQAIVVTRPAAQTPHVHLPDLVERAKKVLQGRHQSPMFYLLRQSKFMQGWRIELRYARDGAVLNAQFQGWREDAKRALGAANLRRRS